MAMLIFGFLVIVGKTVHGLFTSSVCDLSIVHSVASYYPGDLSCPAPESANAAFQSFGAC